LLCIPTQERLFANADPLFFPAAQGIQKREGVPSGNLTGYGRRAGTRNGSIFIACACQEIPACPLGHLQYRSIYGSLRYLLFF